MRSGDKFLLELTKYTVDELRQAGRSAKYNLVVVMTNRDDCVEFLNTVQEYVDDWDDQ
jgi:hypothetical protein